MSYSGDAAEQVVSMTLDGVEVAAKITGQGAERIVTMLYAMSKDNKKTKSHIRLAEMLKSEKPFKVFSVRDQDLKEFCRHAKSYGIRYCVIKDRKTDDGRTDLLISAEDASKVNRIFERYFVSTVKEGETVPPPERTDTPSAMELFDDTPVPSAKEEAQTANPRSARTAESRQSAPSSGMRSTLETSEGTKRPSVRQELKEIRAEQEARSKTPRVPYKKPPTR